VAKTLIKNDAKLLYTISEVAQQAGLSIETLRRMDRKGEFKPSATTPGGQRRYTSEDIGRLFDIRRERKRDVSRRCLTISFVNVKGGVGKSTLAITLAGALAQRGYRVLVIDADPQANATQGLGLDPERTTPTMARALLPEGDRDRLPLADVVQPLPNLHPRLFLAPSHIDLALVEGRLHGLQVQREIVLDEALDTVRADYDLIFVDSPPTISNLLINVMVASDGVIVPIDATYALSGVSALNQTRALCAKVNRHPVLLLGAVLNKQVMNTTMHNVVLAQTEMTFGAERVFKAMLPYRTEIEKATHRGEPVVFSSDPAAAPYVELADEIMKVATERLGARATADGQSVAAAD